MKYFGISIAFILLVVLGVFVVSRTSDNMARESGRDQTIRVEQTPKQAQEDDSVFNTQRLGDDHVPRDEDEIIDYESRFSPADTWELQEREEIEAGPEKEMER